MHESIGYKNIDSNTISFGIAPRINACGRMGAQEEALKLFLTDDKEEAKRITELLNKYNNERQQTEKNIFEQAIAEIEKDKKDEQIEDLTDRLKRQMAEFENFRKRTEKEKTQMYDMGAKGIVEKILPVIDNFERGLYAASDEQKEDPFVDGMNKIYKQMMTVLEEAGVKPIEAKGQEFNPDFHNAVMHIEDEAFGENIVAEELQKGYMYRDTVVRHSMVKVAN